MGEFLLSSWIWEVFLSLLEKGVLRSPQMGIGRVSRNWSCGREMSCHRVKHACEERAPLRAEMPVEPEVYGIFAPFNFLI